ncbi:MAG: CHC2 zinc finger domain-containing protein [Desulfuromonadaceae bacterium]
MNLQRMSDNTGLPLSECRAGRIEYLTRHIQERALDAVWLADDTGELSAHFAQQVLDEVLQMARELRHLTRLAKGSTSHVGSITPELIEQSRLIPIEQLIEFDRQGKAVAWCHDDKVPSLTWHRSKNRATCFPCGKSFNSIDVLIQRDGMAFVDAVKTLSGGAP